MMHTDYELSVGECSTDRHAQVLLQYLDVCTTNAIGHLANVIEKYTMTLRRKHTQHKIKLQILGFSVFRPFRLINCVCGKLDECL